MTTVIVHRNVEDVSEGVAFTNLRLAMEHIKEMALLHNETVRDYTIVPIIEEE